MTIDIRELQNRLQELLFTSAAGWGSHHRLD